MRWQRGREVTWRWLCTLLLLLPPHGALGQRWGSAGSSRWPCSLFSAAPSATLKTSSLRSLLPDDVFAGQMNKLIAFLPRAKSPVRARAPCSAQALLRVERSRPCSRRAIPPQRALTTLLEKSDRPRGSRTPTLFSNHCNSQAGTRATARAIVIIPWHVATPCSSTYCCTAQGEQPIPPRGEGWQREEQPLHGCPGAIGACVMLQHSCPRDAAPA